MNRVLFKTRGAVRPASTIAGNRHVNVQKGIFFGNGEDNLEDILPFFVRHANVSEHFVTSVRTAMSALNPVILKKLKSTGYRVVISRSPYDWPDLSTVEQHWLDDIMSELAQAKQEADGTYISIEASYHPYSNRLFLPELSYGLARVGIHDDVEEPLILPMPQEIPLADYLTSETTAPVVSAKPDRKSVTALYYSSPMAVLTTTLHEIFHAVDYNLGNTPCWRSLHSPKMMRQNLKALLDIGMDFKTYSSLHHKIYELRFVCTRMIGVGSYSNRFSNHPDFIRALNQDVEILKRNRGGSFDTFIQSQLVPKEAFAIVMTSLTLKDENNLAIRPMFPNVIQYLRRNVIPFLEADF